MDRARRLEAARGAGALRLIRAARAHWRAATIAIAFIAACAAMRGGLLSSQHEVDVALYERYAARLVSGVLPYRDFYAEYPPGALPAFLPAYVLGGAHYLLLFKLELVALALATLAAGAVVLRALHADATRTRLAVATAVLAPPLLGPVFLNRYDLWPAALLTFALAAVLHRRAATTGATAGLSFCAKVYAAAAAPVLALHVWTAGGRAALRRASLSAVAVCVVVIGPFAVVGLGGLAFSYYSQFRRGLQFESLGSSLLMAADKLGLYDARFAPAAPNSVDVVGTAARVVATSSFVVGLLLIAAVTVLYARGRRDGERLVAAVAASVAALTVFGKVLSPQYLIWLLPLVPLVAGIRGRIATLALLASLLPTQLEYLHGDALRDLRWPVGFLVARNLLLLVVVAALVDEVRRTVTAPSREPTARAALAARPRL